MNLYAMILIWSVLFFGAVHTYAYTIMNIGIVIAACRYLIRWENRRPVIVYTQTPMNGLLFLFSVLILLYIIPLPQSLIQWISSESAHMNQLAISPMKTVQSIQWGTLAVTDFNVRNAWVQYMVYILFFLGLLQVLNSPQRIKAFSILIITIGVLHSLYGISQKFSDPGYILWVPKTYYLNIRDACGTFINRNHFASMMTMLMLFSVAYSAAQTERKTIQRRNRPFKRRLSQFFSQEHLWSQKILAITAAVIMGLGIFFSASRGAAVAAIPAAIVLTLGLISRKTTRKQGKIMILVGMIIIGYILYIGEDRLINRFNAIQRAMKYRMIFVSSTMDMIKDYPITGVGLSNFVHGFPRYQSGINQQALVTHAHNDWLQLISEMGPIGLLCVLAILFVFVISIFRRWRSRGSPLALCCGLSAVSVLVSVSTHSFFDFSLHVPANVLILISICAIAFQALHLIDHKKDTRTLLHTRRIPLNTRNILIWLIVTCVFISMVRVITCHFIAESYCNTVRNSTLYRNPNPDRAAIQKAISWDPENSVYWYKLAWRWIEYRNTISETTRPKGWMAIQAHVMNALEMAVSKNPCHAEHHIRLAWEYNRMKRHEQDPSARIAAADLSMTRAAIVCGNKNYSHHMEIAHYWNMRSWEQGKATIAQKNWQKAVWHYKKALKLAPRQRCKPLVIEQLEMYHRSLKDIWGGK